MLAKLMSVFGGPATPEAQPAFRHEDSFLTLEQTARDRPYRKTFAFEGEYIDADHRHLAEGATRDGMIDLGIEGRLASSDALKLYELAWFAGGDILELGSYRGLSTALLAKAMVNSGRRDAIYSVGLSLEAIAGSRAALKGRPGADQVSFLETDGDSAIHRFTKTRKRFHLAFVGHSHRYEPVQSACVLIPQVLQPGAFVLFHDYSPRNPAADGEGYGVYQGVRDGLDKDRFAFWGVYGCTGLFRFKG